MELYKNILLVGESKLPGLAERLKSELDVLVPIKELIRLPVIKDTNLTYQGGVILGSMSSSEPYYITAEEYAE